MTRYQKIKRATLTQADGRKRRSRPHRPCFEIDPVSSPAESCYRYYHCCHHPLPIAVKFRWWAGNFIKSDNVFQYTDTIQSPQFFSHSSILPLPLSGTVSLVVSEYRELLAPKVFLEDCWSKKIIESKPIKVEITFLWHLFQTIGGQCWRHCRLKRRRNLGKNTTWRVKESTDQCNVTWFPKLW